MYLLLLFQTMARQFPNMAKTIMNQNARMTHMNKMMKGPKGQPLPGPGMRPMMGGGGQGMPRGMLPMGGGPVGHMGPMMGGPPMGMPPQGRPPGAGPMNQQPPPPQSGCPPIGGPGTPTSDGGCGGGDNSGPQTSGIDMPTSDSATPSLSGNQGKDNLNF